MAEVSRWKLASRVPEARRGEPGTVRFPFLLLMVLIAGSLPTSFPVAQESAPDRLRGHLLVATSQLHDPRFAETVIYIVEHGADGAMGLIINRPMGEAGIGKLLTQKGTSEPDDGQKLLLHYGGPVQLRRGFLLHSTDVMAASSKVVADGVAMTMDRDMLKSIAEGKGPKKYLFALGYSGWGANQLETEIADGSWFTADADESIIFAEDAAQTWKRLIDEHVLRL